MQVMHCELGVMEGQRQVGEPPLLDQRLQLLRGDDSPLGALHCNLPTGNRANKDLISGIGDLRTNGFTEFFNVRQPPHQYMRVQE